MSTVYTKAYYTSTVPVRLRSLRKKAGLTQSALCQKLGIPQSTCSDYETGRVMLRPSVLLELAIFYNTSMDYIAGLTDDPVYRTRRQPAGSCRQPAHSARTV